MLTNDWRVGFKPLGNFHPALVSKVKIVEFPSGNQASIRMSREFCEKYLLCGKCLKLNTHQSHKVPPEHVCACAAASSSGMTLREKIDARTAWKDRQRAIQKRQHVARVNGAQ